MTNEIDELQLYFGYDYHINEKITIHQPKIGDIVKVGERQYYSVVHALTSIPSNMKAQLDDMGVDYEKITDFDFFRLMVNNIKKEETQLLLGDLDLTKFSAATSKENDEVVLYDFDNDIVIDKFIYKLMIDYIRKIHGISPKIEKAGNEYTKKILIEESRLKLQKNVNQSYKSSLQPLISSMVNSEGFKYNLEEVKDMKLYAFMDSVQRIQLIKSANSLLLGCYCGNIDSTKINKNELNWLKGLEN